VRLDPSTLEAEPIDRDDPAVRAAAVAVPLAAGGATFFHHPRTVHRTGPNLTDRRRHVYATELQTAPVDNAEAPSRPWVHEGRAACDARTL
jgi:hypothetical protein